ncbi:MAG: oligopeptide transport system ATP-binding protein [Planctomycetota bacterium]|jgi:oligopeptide transport system ATP-binding protein
MSTTAHSEAASERDQLLVVRDLKKYFPIHKGLFSKHVGDVKAVDGLSFELGRNETLSLVGESGCGKTTAGRTVLRLLDPTAGSAHLALDEGDKRVNLFSLSEREMRPYRRDLQIIFQDPFASLNPRITVGNTIGEALKVHGIATGSELDDRVVELLVKVGLSGTVANRFPHEFSGGQRQRVGIARALALNPKLIICDEAVSALDVSIQAQVINLLKDLQDEFGLSYVFIAHDLSVVRYISHRVAVMYLGKIVEIGTTQQIFENPQHPYTQALLSAIPVPDPTKRKKRIALEGDVPSPINPPAGCHFHTRCPVAEARCKESYPESVAIEDGHSATCHLLAPS